MCVGGAADVLASGGLLENLGDPLGTRRRREEDRANMWAREDKIREATFAHEQKLADKGAYKQSQQPSAKARANRSSLKAGAGGY